MNSFNFDVDRLRALLREDVRIVHRVDGPVQMSRGRDDGSDAWIVRANHDLAQATIFQSQYSLRRHNELGLELHSPVVIPNAPDPAVFHPRGRVGLEAGGRTRLVATSWSENRLKGAEDLRRLEQLLDWSRFELTFVGRSPIAFERIRTLQPVQPEELATILREHHVFVTAHRNEACSNALLEALACGCPVVYVRSGSNEELAGDAGFGYEQPEEIPMLLERLVTEWDERRAAIAVPALTDVADRYLEVLGVA
jgi:glycosyltransferase involved in cell wall biosynthesis